MRLPISKFLSLSSGLANIGPPVLYASQPYVTERNLSDLEGEPCVHSDYHERWSNLREGRLSFSKLIRVLEDALERAGGNLGSECQVSHRK
jgi:hypothetical protein